MLLLEGTATSSTEPTTTIQTCDRKRGFYTIVRLDTEWEEKPCRGTPKKTWRKVISELLLQLNLDSQDILAGDYNVNVFLERVHGALRIRL